MSDLDRVPVRCEQCNERVPVKRTTWAKDDPNKVICWLCAGITVICHECREEVNKSDTTEVLRMPGMFICDSCVREYEDEHGMNAMDRRQRLDRQVLGPLDIVLSNIDEEF